MTAKEMFEELGYECDVSCDGILYSKYLDSERCGLESWQIDFDKVDKKIEKSICEAGFSMKYYNSYIYLDELKAINKQVEELGWNNE